MLTQSYGPFSTEDEMNNIFSWLFFRHGALGLLKTREKWRGNGCAAACIKALSKHLLKFGITPYCFIEDFNHTSMRLFEKLGFEKTHDCSWITFQS